jgi:chromatin assembly factor 1 subunit B
MSQSQQGAAAVNTAYVYARGHWKAPVAHLPALSAPSVAVRFCPHLFQLRPGAARGRAGPSSGPLGTPADGGAGRGGAAGVAGDECPWATLPYRMLFAVATMDSVVIYDTQVGRAL